MAWRASRIDYPLFAIDAARLVRTPGAASASPHDDADNRQISSCAEGARELIRFVT